MMSEVLRGIDTIVVLMMESRSFDHVLGHLGLDGAMHAGLIDGLSGLPIDGLLTDPNCANTSLGRIYQPFELRDGVLPGGLSDDRESVKVSMGRKHGSSAYAMDGFVRAYYRRSEAQRSQRPLPMAFLRAADAPVTNFLARNYAVCDQWFAPLPTGSIPNRLMAMCGVSNIVDTPSNLLSYHPTVFDWMNARRLRYRVYHDGLSFFTLCPWMLDDVAGDRCRDAGRLAEDFFSEPDETFPQFVFVEPSYFDGPVRSDKEANDNRPPSSMAAGEKFLLSVYEAIRANPERFQRTLFIVTYASHGGFYDHVSPLPIRHESLTDSNEAVFATTGLRVPAIVVSPHVESGTVYHGRLDHTSILQLMADKFDGGRPYSAAVAARAEQGIGSVSSVLNLAAPRNKIPVPPAAPLRSRRRQKHIDASPSLAQNAFYLAARALCDHSPSRVARTYPEFWREFAGSDLM
jgi:phospholipase C